jgi:hypothetical protein
MWTLFDDTRVTGTTEIQRFGLTYPEALAWAMELDVAKIGVSFAWTRQDAEALAEALRAMDQEEQEGDEPEEEEDEDGGVSSGDEADDGAEGEE